MQRSAETKYNILDGLIIQKQANIDCLRRAPILFIVIVDWHLQTIILLLIRDMSQEQKVHHKRTRNQAQGKRDFGCPCGKTYLSYPALFTHVKQKHDGIPPGNLIKPKTEKARGRPKINPETPDQDINDDFLNLQQEVECILENSNVEYHNTFPTSEGNQTCQDMASQFLHKFTSVDPAKSQVLHCFLDYLEHLTAERFGCWYWKENSPNEIIDMVNDVCRNHKYYRDKFPLERKTLVDLLYVLFRWMYKANWTEHQLVKREHTKK